MAQLARLDQRARDSPVGSDEDLIDLTDLFPVVADDVRALADEDGVIGYVGDVLGLDVAVHPAVEKGVGPRVRQVSALIAAEVPLTAGTTDVDQAAHTRAHR